MEHCKRCDSYKAAIISLEQKINALSQLNSILELDKKHWIVEKSMQQQIIQQTLNSSNATSQSYLEENSRLREELRQFKG